MARFFSKPAFTITSKTGACPPALLLHKIKTAVLGSRYELSVAFVSPKEGRALHKQFKNTAEALNIFSFPYSLTEGEIVMTLSAARSEAKRFDHTYGEHLAFLFIHGCVHLLGYDHGEAMEKREAVFLKQFKIPNPYKK